MKEITRREMIGGATKGGLVLSAGSLIAACGSVSTGSSNTAGAGKPRRGGTLKAGLTGGSSTDTIDPNNPVNSTDYARVTALYDALVWQDAQARPYMRAAQEISSNKDATVWTIRLRKGMLFHDGREATADDLIFSIKRVVNPKAPGEAANVLKGVQVSAIRKLDRYTITLPFSHPYSTFIDSIANNITVYLLPTDFDAKKPVGTGPFKYVSFTPGQQSVFARWEHYWDQPRPYLDKLVMIDYTDETSQVNALLAGQVDVVNSLSDQSLTEIKSGNKQVVISDGAGWVPFTMRVDAPPFNDVRVRQAMRLLVDRPKMLEIVFGGHGTIGNDVFSIADPYFDHSLPQRQQDVEQAKHLLKAAGQENLSVQLITAPQAQGTVNMAEELVQDAAQGGVKLNLRQLTVTGFDANYLKWPFAQSYWYYAPYFPQVSEATLPTSPFNETHFDDSRYNSLYSQALATLDKAKQMELAHEMQTIDYNEGGYIIPFFPATIDGHAPTVGGVVPSKTGASFNDWDFRSMWIA
jgi:peptide/nickel transport system substrate-binding protein